MIEKEIGYRGSKSDFMTNLKANLKLKSVKEQRVDGSWQVGGASCLRCTLMGFERNYRLRIPSNLMNRNTIRYYSSKPVQQCEKQNLMMDP